MEYLTFEQYKDYGGQLEEEDFNSLLDLAQEIININTNNRLVKLEELPPNIAPFIRKATYYQLEYLSNTGGIDAVLGVDAMDDVKSESLGKYSVSYSTDSTSPFKVGGIVLNALAANELDKAYLRNRWIGRC